MVIDLISIIYHYWNKRIVSLKNEKNQNRIYKQGLFNFVTSRGLLH